MSSNLMEGWPVQQIGAHGWISLLIREIRRGSPSHEATQGVPWIQRELKIQPKAIQVRILPAPASLAVW